MNIIKIDKRDFDFLIKSKLDENILHILRTNCKEQYDTIELSINKELIGSILEFLDGDLVNKGFKVDDEHNEYGIMLENLIDKFSRVYYLDSSGAD
jgi:hypothetical protein